MTIEEKLIGIRFGKLVVLGEYVPNRKAINKPHQVYLVKNATSDNKTSQFTYNGLDRIDTKRGYDKDNVVPCCGTCNFMRHELSLSEFYMHITKIVKHRGWDLPKRG